MSQIIYYILVGFCAVVLVGTALGIAVIVLDPIFEWFGRNRR